MGSMHLSGAKVNWSYKPKPILYYGEKCIHYGNTKHTRETCFKLHGYVDQWNEHQEQKKHGATTSDEGLGRVVVATIKSLISHEDDSLNDQGNFARVFHSPAHHDNRLWIINSRATYHMAFDSNYFCESTPPRKNCIGNAKGVTYSVTKARTMTLSHMFLYLTLDLSRLCQIN